MPAFVFKLEPVLRQRQMAEDQRQRELAQLMRHQMIMMDQLRQMQQTISGSKQDLAGSLVGKVDLQAVSGFARFSGQTTQRAHGLVRKLAELEQQVQAARQRLIEASRERRAIEKLKQNRYEQWKREHERREAAVMDELAMQNYQNQQRDLTAAQR